MEDKAMAMEALDQVSGGSYADYVKITDAIHKLNVNAEFNTSWGFDFLNGDAVYKDSRANKAGIRYTQDEVLKMIANWTPKK